MIHNKTIFLTGASGFIGSNLTNKLILQGNRVAVLLRRGDGRFSREATPVRGNVTEPESFASRLEGYDLVYHCAAHISFRKKDFEKAYQVNVVGTRNVLEAALRAGVKKIVHLSAGAVLGFSPKPETVIDETANPLIEKNNVYAYTKKLAEEEVKKYVGKGVDVSIANPATVYGPGDRKLNSGAVIKAIYEGKMKFTPPGGTSFVSVDDLVEGLILLAEKGRAGERYIFCAGNMTYKELARRIATTLNVKEPRHTLPRCSYYPVLGAVKARELFSGSRKEKVDLITTPILKEAYGYKYFSSEKAKKELGWKPWQSFEDAVRQAFDYYLKNGLI